MEESLVHFSEQSKEIYLIKTAHVSKNSVEDVKAIINEVKPEAICIELDEDRYAKLTQANNWENTDITTVIKEKKVGFLLVNVILAAFQKRAALGLGTESGGEMLTAIKLAKENNIPLILADRNIKITFERIWNNLSFKEKFKLLTTIIFGLFDDEKLTEEDIANLKKADMLEASLQEVGKSFPVVKRILLDERDMYLAAKIKATPAKRIVAVIGAAHAKGIQKHFTEEIDLKALCDLKKKPHYFLNTLKWALPLSIIMIIIYTLFQNLNAGLDQIKVWVFWNGTLSALGTALALAHPLTILTAFVAAPITSLNPLLAAGWFAGLTEAYLHKPKVKDFENIASDTITLKGFWHNRVTRILLIVVLANVFSSIATFISGFDIFKNFFANL